MNSKTATAHRKIYWTHSHYESAAEKSVIEEVGGWDENLPSQYDTDLGFRISAKGYKIAYEPNAVCYHYNRPTLHAYYRQQLQYGKNTLKLYFKHGGLAKGDEITDFGMNIQPVLLLAVIVFFLVGIIPLLRPLWYVSGLILLAMFVYFVYSAAKIAVKFHDRVALRLVVLYFVRAFAWFVGAVTTTSIPMAKGGKSPMRKVCFISPEYWPLSGGTGSYVYYLSNELLKNGYKIYVVTGSNQAQDIQVNPQLDVSFLKIPRTPIVKSFMLAAASNRKLQSVRNTANVDITHPQLPLTPNFAVPPNFGKALVCTVHSTWKGEAEAIRGEPYSRLNANEKFLVSFNWFLRFFEEGMLRRARKIIAVSHFTKWELTNYYKIPASKIQGHP